MILALDPGLTGGLCVLGEEGNILLLWDMPLKSGELDILGIQGLFDSISSKIKLCGIEALQFRRGQALQATATTAKNWARLEVLLTVSHTKFVVIQPRSWRSHFGIYGIKDLKARKRASIHKVRELYPDHAGLFHSKKTSFHLGRVEAALIAEYLRSTL